MCSLDSNEGYKDVKFLAGFAELPGKQGFLQLFRTQAQTIYAAQSQNGIDWSNAESIDLPNPNSKVMMLYGLSVSSTNL